jgi:hypothetical protein
LGTWISLWHWVLWALQRVLAMEWTGHKVLNAFSWNISWCAGSWWSQWVVMATFQLLFVMKVIWFDTLWAALMRLWLYSFSHYLEIVLVEISVQFYRFMYMYMYMYEWKHTPMAPFV